MSFLLNKADVELICSEVERFASGSIAPLVERPELVLSQKGLNDLTEIALETGLLSTTEPSGGGLWEQGDEPALLSIRMLSVLAKTNAGVALRFHQFALARHLLEALYLPTDQSGSTALSLVGFYGLGRVALPRYLSGRGVEAEDINFLRSWLAGENFIKNSAKNPKQGGAPFVFTADSEWKTLLHPTINHKGELVFSLYSRENLTVDKVSNSHGFDELSAFCCRGFVGVEPLSVSSLSSELSKKVYTKALQINALAYMTIALGSVRHSYSIASDYAAIRQQGGNVINRHPAVQLLLGELRRTIDTASLILEQLTARPLTFKTLSTLFSVRATQHKKMCDAANAAMQVCGGIGYMQDTGIEKIVRDCNTLRVTDGTPMELTLFVAEWERLHA